MDRIHPVSYTHLDVYKRQLKYKLLECREVQGVWGNFVSFWYPIFYTCDIFKLGRLEYENTTYAWEEPYIKNGYAIKHGDPVKSVHIPSSGEPFDEAARLASYRLAYEFFREELNGGPLVCVCDSWLLYPDYQQILSPSSNILSFQKDFDVISSRTEEEFHDIWRVSAEITKDRSPSSRKKHLCSAPSRSTCCRAKRLGKASAC